MKTNQFSTFINCNLDLYVLDGTLTGQKYRDQTLCPLAVPHFDCHPLTSRPILMDVNVRPHRACIVQNYLQLEAIELQQSKWGTTNGHRVWSRYFCPVKVPSRTYKSSLQFREKHTQTVTPAPPNGRTLNRRLNNTKFRANASATDNTPQNNQALMGTWPYGMEYQVVAESAQSNNDRVAYI
jgi:hypothetical protein